MHSFHYLQHLDVHRQRMRALREHPHRGAEGRGKRRLRRARSIDSPYGE